MLESKYFNLAKEFSDIPSPNLSPFHYIILIVTLFGVILAIFNEDSSSESIRLSWITYEFLPMPESHTLKNSSSYLKIDNTKNSFTTSLYDFSTTFILAISTGSLRGLIESLLKKYHEKKDLWNLWKAAKSKRHIAYLIEKKVYGLPINRGETEMTSYLDAKRHMIKVNKWPFFWTVKNVRDKYIDCEGYPAMTMSSYSYLDFVRNDTVQNAAINAAQNYATGNHGPRMLGGGSKILRELEIVTGKFFGRRDSLVFATGYLASMSAPPAVCQKGDLIVYDSRSHASLQAGIKLSGAQYYLFKHNDYENCEVILKKYRKKYRDCWIIMESVYSMDGDIGDLPKAHHLAKKYNCRIILDEAHGLGVLGKTGRGLEEFYNLPGVCDLIVGTYSKSIGGIGGYIVGNDDYVEFLDFHSQGSLFSAPLTAYSAGGAIKAFELIDKEPQIIQRLHRNIKCFREVLNRSVNWWPAGYPDKNKFEVHGSEYSSVIPIVYPNDPDRVFKITITLRNLGFLVSAVAYPACPLKYPRLRITVTSSLEEADIINFIEALIIATVENVPQKILI